MNLKLKSPAGITGVLTNLIEITENVLKDLYHYLNLNTTCIVRCTDNEDNMQNLLMQCCSLIELNDTKDVYFIIYHDLTSDSLPKECKPFGWKSGDSPIYNVQLRTAMKCLPQSKVDVWGLSQNFTLNELLEVQTFHKKTYPRLYSRLWMLVDKTKNKIFTEDNTFHNSITEVLFYYVSYIITKPPVTQLLWSDSPIQRGLASLIA